MHEWSGGWAGAYVLLIGSAVVAAIGGYLLRKPRFVEDDLQRGRSGSPRDNPAPVRIRSARPKWFPRTRNTGSRESGAGRRALRDDLGPVHECRGPDQRAGAGQC